MSPEIPHSPSPDHLAKAAKELQNTILSTLPEPLQKHVQDLVQSAEQGSQRLRKSVADFLARWMPFFQNGSGARTAESGQISDLLGVVGEQFPGGHMDNRDRPPLPPHVPLAAESVPVNVRPRMETAITPEITATVDALFPVIDRFVETGSASITELRQAVARVRGVTRTPEQEQELELILTERIQRYGTNAHTRALPLAVTIIVGALYQEGDNGTTLDREVNRFNTIPLAGYWRMRLEGGTVILQGPEQTFWENFDHETSLIERTTRLIEGNSDNRRHGTERIIERLERQLKMLRDPHGIEGPRIEQETKRVLADLARERKTLADIDAERVKQRRDELAAEQERLEMSLLTRIRGMRQNVELTQKRMNSFNFIERALSSQNMRMLALTIEEDQRSIQNFTAIYQRLQVAPQDNLEVWEKEINEVRRLLGMARLDYRDVNAVPLRERDFEQQHLATVRPAFTVDEEVYALVDEHTLERGWRVQSVEGTTVNVSKNGQTLSLPTSQVWHTGEIEGGRAFNLAVPRHALAEMLNRRSRLLERYARLSAEDYHRMFDGPLQQQNVGNCYLIASFAALQASPHCESVLRTSVRVHGDGWQVRIPLGDAEGQWVTVTRAEMGSMMIERDAQGREELRPVVAAEGWVVLEAAYTKHRFGSVDRRASEGGHADLALQHMFSARQLNTRLIFADGRENSFNDVPSQQSNAEAWLDSFQNQREIGTVSTPHRSEGDRGTFEVDGQRFFYSHAYAVLRVDRQARTVIVANPHNTGNQIHLTYNQFMRAFRTIKSVEINYNRMFRT